MIMVRYLFQPVKDLQTLMVQSFVVKKAGIVQLFMQLDVDVPFAAHQTQAGQHLLVEVRLDIRKLVTSCSALLGFAADHCDN